MGAAGSGAPRVVLRTDLQIYFKGAKVKKEVAEIVKGWQEDGAPLGLTLDTFEQALRLHPNGTPEPRKLFEVFDTDLNQKVDAFEVLAATVVLANGTEDEKLEAIFPVFDFSATTRLNFDEANILVASVQRGLQKVCNTRPLSDEETIEVCRQMFDCHNLPYDKQISKEQVRRWLKADMEAEQYLASFQNSYSLPALEANLAQKEQEQADVLTSFGEGASVMAADSDDLLRSDAFRRSLGNPSEETFRAFVAQLADGPSGRRISPDRFAEGCRAWNAFTAIDLDSKDVARGEVYIAELALLLWLQLRKEPNEDEVRKQREAMGLGQSETISRDAWVAARTSAAAA